MIKNFKWLLLVSLTFVACDNNDDNNTPTEPPLTPGTANFSKYVALGNSLTAGFCDSALFIDGQQGSYTNILAQQFSLVGGGEFVIPLMNDNIGGLLYGGNIIQGPRLYFDTATSTPVPVQGPPTTEITDHLTGPFNNMGVPGAKSFHLLAPNYGNIAGVATGQANPYFVRFASTPSATILEDALAQDPTFFSLWIGNNDVLSYATSGGTGVNQTGNPNPATYGPNDITDPTLFAGVYSTLVNSLTANGAKGVVANIPYVTTVPFFTTVPTNPVPLDQATATQLNSLFGPLNSVLNAYGQPARFATLTASNNNPLLIFDESLPNFSAQITGALISFGYPTSQATFIGNLYGQARSASNDPASIDYILLTARGVIGTPQAGYPSPFNIVGVSYPMPDSTTLTATETAQVVTATNAYNASILALSQEKGLAFVDANAALAQINNGGVSKNGFTFLSTYVTGGTFSLDGVHPSPRGYAFIADKFLEAINLTYGSNFKGVNVGLYQILYPQTLP